MESISMSTSNPSVSELAESQSMDSVKTANVQKKEEPPQKETTGTSEPKSLPEGGTLCKPPFWVTAEENQTFILTS